MNRIDRLVGIILFLQSKRIVQAVEIANHFEKSLRTVYRDMQALSEAGLPLIAEPGEGYSLMKGYYLPPLTLTHGEASAILLGAEFVEKKADSSYKNDAQSAILKIKSVLKSETKNYINEIEKSILIIDENSLHKNILADIQNAISNRTLIKLKYYSLSKNEITLRIIEPVGLIHYGDNWRIIAFCRLRKDFREFRINRIKSIEFAKEQFDIRKNFSLNNFVSKEYKIKDPIEVKIWFDNKTARYVKEKHTQGLCKTETAKNGEILYFLFAKDRLDAMANWVLSFYRSAKVLSPTSFQNMIQNKISGLVEIYR